MRPSTFPTSIHGVAPCLLFVSLQSRVNHFGSVFVVGGDGAYGSVITSAG
jgi:hypothetical protein